MTAAIARTTPRFLAAAALLAGLSLSPVATLADTAAGAALPTLTGGEIISAPQQTEKKRRVYQKTITAKDGDENCNFAIGCMATFTTVKNKKQLEIGHVSCVFLGGDPFYVPFTYVFVGEEGNYINDYLVPTLTAAISGNTAYSVNTQTRLIAGPGQTLGINAYTLGSGDQMSCTVTGEMVTFK